MSHFFVRLGKAVFFSGVAFFSLTLLHPTAHGATAIEMPVHVMIDIDGTGRILAPQPNTLVTISQNNTILDILQTDLNGTVLASLDSANPFYNIETYGAGSKIESAFSAFSPLYTRFVQSVSRDVLLEAGTIVDFGASFAGFDAVTNAVREGAITGTGSFSRGTWIKAINKNIKNPNKGTELINEERFFRPLRTLTTVSFGGDFSGDNFQIRATALAKLRPDCDPEDRDVEHCHLAARMESQFLTYLLNNPVIALDPPAPIEEIPPDSKPPVPSFSLLYKGILDNLLFKLRADLSNEADRRLVRDALTSVRTFNRDLQEPPVRPEYSVITTISNGAPQVGTPFIVTVTATNNTAVRSEEDFQLLIQVPSGIRITQADPQPTIPIVQFGSFYVVGFSPMDSGESRTITLTAVADRVSADDLSLTVYGGPDNDTRNNSSPTVVRPQPTAGLSVSVESPSEVIIGENSEYVVKVRQDNSALPPQTVDIKVRFTSVPSGAGTVIQGSITGGEGGEIVAVRENEVEARVVLRPQDEARVGVIIFGNSTGTVTAEGTASSPNLEPVRVTMPAVPVRQREEFFVNITQPAANSMLDGLVAVLYDHSANIVRAVTHLDERLLCDEQPPTGSCSFDSTGLANGDYHLIVTGYRQDGQTVSDSITVFVDTGIGFIEDPLRPNPIRVVTATTVSYGGDFNNGGRSETDVEVRFTTDSCGTDALGNKKCSVRTSSVRQDGTVLQTCLPFDNDGGISCTARIAADSSGRFELDVTPSLTPAGFAAGGGTMAFDLSLLVAGAAAAGGAIVGNTDVDPPPPSDCALLCEDPLAEVPLECCFTEPACANRTACSRF